MAQVLGMEKVLSILPTRRLGVFCKFGTSQMGFTNYGDDDIYFPAGPNGPFLLSGIYRRDPRTGRIKVIRNRYYITKNPRTISQQLNRQKYANAVAAWQGLTLEEKTVYNARARYKGLSGYNLFIKNYMLSS